MNKPALISTLEKWINQRPGLEPANYISGWNDSEGRSAYRSESRSITRDLHHARELLRYVEARDSITAERILDACKHNFSGRLSIEPDGDGFSIDYCTGQYWPTEYRRAACAVLAGAVWGWLRDECIKSTDGMQADKIRKAAAREFSRPVARRWFN